jgi:hypothetical protein
MPLPIPGLVQHATVYGLNPTTGLFDVVVMSDLVCRLAHRGGGATAPERAELAGLRRLLWRPEDGELPENAQIEAEGQRWQVVRGTPAAFLGPDGTIALRAADLVLQAA